MGRSTRSAMLIGSNVSVSLSGRQRVATFGTVHRICCILYLRYLSITVRSVVASDRVVGGMSLRPQI